MKNLEDLVDIKDLNGKGEWAKCDLNYYESPLDKNCFQSTKDLSRYGIIHELHWLFQLPMSTPMGYPGLTDQTFARRLKVYAKPSALRKKLR